uniref:Uncharacterized protein n=1 Tax=Ciona intestinalis TaxID=7719 RepID=F7BNJ8_CIOIN
RRRGTCAHSALTKAWSSKAWSTWSSDLWNTWSSNLWNAWSSNSWSAWDRNRGDAWVDNFSLTWDGQGFWLAWLENGYWWCAWRKGCNEVDTWRTGCWCDSTSEVTCLERRGKVSSGKGLPYDSVVVSGDGFAIFSNDSVSEFDWSGKGFWASGFHECGSSCHG